jgi:hypothetical protein
MGGLVPDGRHLDNRLGQQRSRMPTQETQTSVTFSRPFTLSSVEGLQPAGTYRLDTDERQTEGLSFNAFRRMTMALYLPAMPGVMGHVVQVDPKELAEALLADAA